METAGKLKVGRFYQIEKNNPMYAIYLGKNYRNHYLFYRLEPHCEPSEMTEAFIKRVIAVQLINNYSIVKVTDFSSRPRVYKVDFDLDVNLDKLKNKLLLLGKHADGITDTVQTDQIDKKFKPVKKSELQVGKFYISVGGYIGTLGERHSPVYLYLGTNNLGQYVYVHYNYLEDVIYLDNQSVYNSVAAQILRGELVSTSNPKQLYIPDYCTEINDLIVDLQVLAKHIPMFESLNLNGDSN